MGVGRWLYLAIQLAIVLANEPDIITWISPSALLEEIGNVEVYEETVNLLFTIPGIPPPPRALFINECSFPHKFDDDICINAKVISEINDQTFTTLKTMQKSFTLRGIASEDYNIKVTEPIEYPRSGGVDITEVKENEWYQLWNAALNDRGFKQLTERSKRDTAEFENDLENSNENYNSTLSRQKRSLALVAKAGLALFGKKSLGTLFMATSEILPSLHKMLKELPKAFTSFLDVPKFQSGFSAIKKKAAQVVKQKMNEFPKLTLANVEMYDSKRLGVDVPHSFVRIVALFLVLNQQTAAIASASTMTIAQSLILNSCRSGYIPILVLPPLVLRNRLIELEQELAKSDGSLKLVYSSADFMKYFSLPLAECKFDDDGGILAVKIHLRRKSTNYRIFKFQSYAFQYHSDTCEVAIPTSFVIKEESSKSLYTVTDIDEENCKPQSSPLCKLPHAANADVPNFYCLSTLMSGGSAAEIKAACPLTCRPGSRLTTVAVNEDTLIISHLPKNGSTVKCSGNEEIPLTHDLEAGAIRLTLGCGCSVLYRGRTIGRSIQKHCESGRPQFTMEYIIPVALTDFDNWIPNIINGYKGMQFKGKITTNLIESLSKRPVESNSWNVPRYFWIWPAVAGVSSIFQWVCLFAIFCKQRHARLAIVLPSFPTADGAAIMECKDGSEETILEYIIIGLIACYCIPLLAHKAYIQIKESYDGMVRNAATNIVAFNT